jgi:hypothetical protein
MWGFYPSTQRRYRRLIYYLYIYICLCNPRCYIFFPDDGRMIETCSIIYKSNKLTYDSDVA